MTISGRQEKLNYIAENYMKLMLKSAYSVVSDTHQAEDACQEAFIRIIKYIDKIEDVAAARAAALCAVIARHTAIDLYRKTAREVPVSEVYAADAPPYGSNGSAQGGAADGGSGDLGRSLDGTGTGGNPEAGRGAVTADEPYEKAEQKEAIERLAGLIRQLPDHYREVLRLRCLNGLSAADTAKLLGISENTVNIRLTRARKMLREQLDGT